jgi:hypothetical protein
MALWLTRRLFFMSIVVFAYILFTGAYIPSLILCASLGALCLLALRRQS